MPQENSINPIFARHETFHPRFGWLKKGFDKNSVFSTEKDDACSVLGVGRNMVKAIRYWCLAFKIINQHDGKKRNSYKRTSLGTNLFMENGWDPFLEDPSSLWLLHWNLFTPPVYATAWYFVFNEFNQVSFTSEELLNSLKEYCQRVYPTKSINDSSLLKDVNCILRMYVSRNTTRILREDSIDCPFVELDLIK